MTKTLINVSDTSELVDACRVDIDLDEAERLLPLELVALSE